MRAVLQITRLKSRYTLSVGFNIHYVSKQDTSISVATIQQQMEDLNNAYKSQKYSITGYLTRNFTLSNKIERLAIRLK
jgi:hypothetical protein